MNKGDFIKMLLQDLEKQRKLQREYAEALRRQDKDEDKSIYKALGTEAQAKEFYIQELIERIEETRQ